MQPQADALKQAHAHVRQSIKDVAAAFEQDPPDQDALQAAIGRVKQAKAEVNDVVGTIIETVYMKLSPDGRRRLTEMTQ
jgi:uncharacterized membrane protein